ncbi:putative ribonuclease H-like domain-containing protein [Tanacetum coccineum]
MKKMGAEADFNNMDNTIDVSSILTLRVHKDHPKGQILGDPKSTVQTRGKIQKASSVQQALTMKKFLHCCEELRPIRGGTIVHQPPGFVDPAHPNKVYKVIKALYGLHQAPRAWYETLSSFLLKNGFRRDQHNMVACLEKTTGNSDFHEIVDFLTSSSIHHALTLINAIVDDKEVVVTEPSIRSFLLFNDADENLALMGYKGDFNKLTFQKALFSPQWKFLIHTILHCLSLKSTSWNEFSTNIASAVICLATNQKFNFSKLIFDGMLRNLDNTKKKFLMYPRVLTLESIKDAQAAKINALKSRIKKLEKKCKPSISHHRAWLKSLKKNIFEEKIWKEGVYNGMEYMETKEVVDEGRQSGETEEVKLTDDTEEVAEVIRGTKMDASEELAARLQMEEREMYTIEERSKLLAEFFERRKKLLAEERVAVALYIKEQERDADFVPIRSERDEKMIEKMNKKAAGMDEEEVSKEPESTKVEVKQEGHEKNFRKRSEEEQLRFFLKIVPDEEEEIDYEVLDTRVFRANGSSRYIKTFTEMVSRFDRLDFIELHSLVMQRFSTTTPEGIDLVLWET